MGSLGTSDEGHEKLWLHIWMLEILVAFKAYMASIVHVNESKLM